VAVAGAIAAMVDKPYFDRTRQAVIASRETLTAELTELGFEVLPSAANFVFTRHPRRDAGELAQALRARGIIVRHFRQPRIEQFLRITIGTEMQCRTLVDALRALLAEPAQA
jgi:histidinol-phosphate aminotransferase